MSAEQIPLTEPKGEEFLLVDLSSIAYPIWHMSQSEPNPDAASIKTVERVRALTASHRRAAICCDSGKSFRAEVDPTYKANRPATEETLRHQIKLAIETLKADGFPVWAVKGYEADDIIATATAKALEIPSARVLIASADKDLLALVGPRASVKSTNDGTVYDEAGVLAKLGVKPCQVPDYLTLCGDSSDNIKGAKGIGPKKAVELLRTFVELDMAYACINDGTGKFQPATLSALQELQPRLETVRALVTMKADVPLPFDEILADRVPKPSTAPSMEDAMGEEAIEAEGEAFAQATTPTAATAAASESAATTEHTTALVVRKPDVLAPAPVEWERQLEPRSMREAMSLAENLHKSMLFGAYGAPQGVLAVVLAGRELGLQASAALRAFHVIEGRPTLSADLIRALVIKSGKAKYFRCIERTAQRATFTTQRADFDDPPVDLSYTVEEGRLAWPKSRPDWEQKFQDSGWGRNPADMCVARASSKLARLVYSDVIHGLYAFEEMDAQ